MHPITQGLIVALLLLIVLSLARCDIRVIGPSDWDNWSWGNGCSERSIGTNADGTPMYELNPDCR